MRRPSLFRVFIALFLALLFGPRAAFAQSLKTTFTQMEQALETALQATDPATDETEKIARSMAEAYFKNHHDQEAIWALDRAGLYQEAESLAQAYQNFLQTAEIIKVEALGVGVSGAKLVTLANGSKAIVKPRERSLNNRNSLEAEIWAYEFDRMLGLNLVPATVKRVIGGFEYSVQGFIPQSKHTGVDLRTNQNLDPSMALLYAFDFLVGNSDRHSANSMRTIADRLFGIDHGRIGNAEYRKTYPAKLHVPKWLRRRLVRLRMDEEFFRFCRQYSNLDMSFVGDKILALRSVLKIEDQEGRLDRRPFTVKERLSSLHIGHGSQLQVRFQNSLEPSTTTASVLEMAEANGVNEETLPLWIDTRAQLNAAMALGDIAQIKNAWRLSRSHPRLAEIFIQDLASLLPSLEKRMKALPVFAELKEFVFQQPEILLALVASEHQWPFQAAIHQPEFALKVLDRIEKVPNPEARNALFQKYILETLNQQQRPSAAQVVKSISEIAGRLQKNSMEELLGWVSPELISSPKVLKDVFQLYQSDPHKMGGLYAALVFSPVLYRTKPTLETLQIFANLLNVKHQAYLHEKILTDISRSPNSAQLFQVYTEQSLSGKNAQLGVSLLLFQLKLLSEEQALKTFSKYLSDLPTQLAVKEFITVAEKQFFPKLSKPVSVPAPAVGFSCQNIYQTVRQAM